MPDDGVEPYVRRDIQHVDASERPTAAQYDRYLWLIQHFRGLGWNNSKLHDASPFQVIDPSLNAILIRSDQDLAVLAERFGCDDIAKEARERSEKALSAIESLWHEELGQYVCFDRAADHLIESASIGGLLPVFAGVDRHDHLAARISELLDRQPFGVASHAPDDPRYDGKRYWRGPSWVFVNMLLAEGLRQAGHHDVATRVTKASLALLEEGQFAEYYDPENGRGGGRFTWTAAMTLEFLRGENAA